MKIGPLSGTGNAWSLLDQAWVSGVNFLIGIALARSLGLQSYGEYAVAQTYLLYANTFQASLVVAPMMTSVPAADGAAAQRRLLSGYFGFMLVVLAITVGLVQFAGWLLGSWSPSIGLHELAWPLTAAMVGFQAQDWLRRAMYARDRIRAAFVSDTLAYGGQLLALIVLARQGSLTPSYALWALALAFGFSALVTAAGTRLTPSVGQMVAVIRTEWRASRNFWASWQLQWVASSGVVLVGAGLVGVQAAGAIRAVQNLTGPINVFFQWMDNVVPVRCATQLRTGGLTALLAFLRRLHVMGILPLATIGTLLTLFAGPLLGWVYGDAYVPFALLVAMQAAYYILQYSYRMEAYLRRALAQTDLLARASLFWALASVGGAAALVPAWAERGILGGMLLGQLAALVYLHQMRKSDRSLAGIAVRPTHFVLSHRHGRGRLVLPTANRHVLRATLDMYYPSRWGGRLYRRLLALLLPPGLWLGIPVIARSAGEWCPALPQVIAAIPGRRDLLVGGLVGYGWPRAKTTLKIMTADGQAVAYGRVADRGDSAAALRSEAQVLDALVHIGAANQTPQVLGQGTIAGGDGFFLLQSAGPLARAGSRLGQPEFTFLCRLVSDDVVRWSDAVDTMERELSWAAEQPETHITVPRVIAALRGLQVETLPRCIEHGDFAPWNIRQRKDGTIFVIDWEHARLDGLPWLDAMHHRLQSQFLVRNLGPVRAVARAMQVFRAAEAAAYAAKVDTARVPPWAFVCAYLLRALSAGHLDGHAPGSAQQSFRLGALEVLRNDHRLG